MEIFEKVFSFRDNPNLQFVFEKVIKYGIFNFLFRVCCFCLSKHRVSPCSSGWNGIPSVDQIGLEPTDLGLHVPPQRLN